MVETSAPQQITVRLDPNGIIAPLHRILRESSDNVALGLHAIDQYHADVLPDLPTRFFHFTIGDEKKILTAAELENLKDNFRTWLLTTALQEFVKAVFAALREAYLYCEVATAWPGTFDSISHMRGHIDLIRTKAQKFDLPTLLDRVSARLKAPLDLTEHILSINKVRNCLEHRHGVVTTLDTNDEAKSSLVMKWRRPKIFYEMDGREIEVTIGSVVGGKDPVTVMATFVDAMKIFDLGKRISLSVDEFNQVMFTCDRLGVEIVRKLPDPPQARDRADSPTVSPSSLGPGKKRSASSLARVRATKSAV